MALINYNVHNLFGHVEDRPQSKLVNESKRDELRAGWPFQDNLAILDTWWTPRSWLHEIRGKHDRIGKSQDKLDIRRFIAR